MDHQFRTVFIDAKKYCSLALSRRNIERADYDREDERGLIDLERRIRYVVRDDQLFDDDFDPEITDSLTNAVG